MHEKKIGAPVRPLGKIMQSIFFMPNQESVLAGLFENGLVRVRKQGLKRFLPNHLTAPRPPRMETRPLVA